MLKNHTPLCLLLSFCTTEYLVSITINGMCECPITLHLLICLFYLLWLNIISLISPKIILALCLLFAFCKNGILFLPWEKNWSGQNRSSRTDSAGPAIYVCIVILFPPYHMTYINNICEIVVNQVPGTYL